MGPGLQLCLSTRARRSSPSAEEKKQALDEKKKQREDASVVLVHSTYTKHPEAKPAKEERAKLKERTEAYEKDGEQNHQRRIVL